MGETEGFVKTVFDAKTGELFGAHMIGAEVTELIQGYTIGKQAETGRNRFHQHRLPAPDLERNDARGGARGLWTGSAHLKGGHHAFEAIAHWGRDIVGGIGAGRDLGHRRPLSRRPHRPLRRQSRDPDRRRRAHPDGRPARRDDRSRWHQDDRPRRHDPPARPHRHARPSRQPGRHRRLSRARIHRQLLGHDRGRQCTRRCSTRASPPSATSARATATTSASSRRSTTGYAIGPRIVPAGYALGATGGHCDSTFLPPSLENDGKEEGIGDSPEELRIPGSRASANMAPR